MRKMLKSSCVDVDRWEEREVIDVDELPELVGKFSNWEYRLIGFMKRGMGNKSCCDGGCGCGSDYTGACCHGGVG